MSQVADLAPPQDAGLEVEVIGFDFGPIMRAGETIATATLTCVAVVGDDPNAASRWQGFMSIVPSDSTGAPSAQVNKQFGGILGGVKYRLDCNVVTISTLTPASQQLNLFTHITGLTPT